MKSTEKIDWLLLEGNRYLRLREKQDLPSSWLTASEKGQLQHLKLQFGLEITTRLEDHYKKKGADDTRKLYEIQYRGYDPLNEVLTPEQEAHEAARCLRAAHEMYGFHESYAKALGFGAVKESHIYQSQQTISEILAALKRIPDFQPGVTISHSHIKLRLGYIETFEEGHDYFRCEEQELLALLETFPVFVSQNKLVLDYQDDSPAKRRKTNSIQSPRQSETFTTIGVPLDGHASLQRDTSSQDEGHPTINSSFVKRSQRVKISLPVANQSAFEKHTRVHSEARQSAHVGSTEKRKRTSKPLKSTHKGHVLQGNARMVMQNSPPQPTTSAPSAGWFGGAAREVKRVTPNQSFSFTVSNLPPSLPPLPLGLTGSLPEPPNLFNNNKNKSSNRGHRREFSFSSPITPMMNPTTPPTTDLLSGSLGSSRHSSYDRNPYYQPNMSPTPARAPRGTSHRVGRGVNRDSSRQTNQHRYNNRTISLQHANSSTPPFMFNSTSSFEFASISFSSTAERDNAVVEIENGILRNPAFAALSVVEPHPDGTSLKVSGPLHQNLRGKLGTLFNPSIIRASMN